MLDMIIENAEASRPRRRVDVSGDHLIQMAL